MNPEYLAIAFSAVEPLVEAAPSIVSDIKSLLPPLKRAVPRRTQNGWQLRLRSMLPMRRCRLANFPGR